MAVGSGKSYPKIYYCRNNYYFSTRLQLISELPLYLEKPGILRIFTYSVVKFRFDSKIYHKKKTLSSKFENFGYKTWNKKTNKKKP